jgi:glycosyltransferase involved in cell wall biosynthesis
MKISYAIPVCNEHEELKRLLDFLIKHIDQEDEIIVQCDQGNTTHEVYEVLDQIDQSWQNHPIKNPIKVIEFPLKGDFASFKNNLKENCSGNWIFQIDADELPHESLTINLKELLKVNPTTDLFLIPRVNTVDGLTQGHINQWRWNVNEKGWVNWPDYQTRIVQNNPKIKWTSKVHEVLTGHESYVLLPQEEEWCLYHPKHILRQEAQNNFYSTL